MWSSTSKAEMLNWAAFNGCKWVFLHCNAWHPIFPHRRKHMEPIQTLPYCFIYKTVSRLFFPLTFSTCWAHFDNEKIKKTLWLKGTKTNTLCKLFFTPTVLDYTTTAIHPFNKTTETTFPVMSIIFKWAGSFSFFFFATRHKVIKS